MVVGVLLGIIPGYFNFLNAITIKHFNILLSLFLIGMIYPSLVTVQYTFNGLSKKLFILSFIQNWIIGPFLMFFLALGILHNSPEYLTGIILVGLARCIAMVLVWIVMANGDMQNAIAIVGFNSIFQLIFYSFYAQFMINILLPLFNINIANALQVPFILVFESVMIYLGIPFMLALCTKLILYKYPSNKALKIIALITPISLLFVIVLLFSTQAQNIVHLPIDILLIMTPLLCYFIIMYTISYTMGYISKLPHDQCVVLGFTAASNNFELAIAICVGIFGQYSPVVLAATVGPLIEVPVMMLLVVFTNKISKGATEDDMPLHDNH